MDDIHATLLEMAKWVLGVGLAFFTIITITVMFISCDEQDVRSIQQAKISEFCGPCSIRYELSTYPVVESSPDCLTATKDRLVCTEHGWTPALTIESYARNHPNRCPVKEMNNKDRCWRYKHSKENPWNH